MNTKIIREQAIIHEHISYRGNERIQTNEIILNDEQFNYLLGKAEKMEKIDEYNNIFTK